MHDDGTAYEVTGGCLCATVRYRVTGPARSVEHCHCSMCRRAHGALYASGALIGAAQLSIEKGAETLTRYQSSPGNWRAFCATCGAQLFVTVDRLPDEVYYWAATLDDGAHPGHAPDRECHIYVAAGAPWETLDDSLPRYAERAPGIGAGTC